MNILQIEQERTNLKEKLTAQYSTQARLLLLFSFFDKVLSTENNTLIDASLPEFIPEYVLCLKNFSVFGLMPRIHESVIHQAEQIKNSGHTSGFEDFSGILTRLKDELEKLQRILKGERTETPESKAFFPLLEEDAIKETEHSIGILESVTIKVHSAKKENKFIIVPSEKEIEEKISEQVKLSWLNAIRIANKYIKRIHPHLEVIISFDQKAGFCKGNSLGTALTLAFIEEILAVYNSPVSIKVGDGVAFTGGMDENGRITNTSEEIIKQKTELVFYSNINHFVVPKEEENSATEKLKELQKDFPKRDIRIIGIEDINDLLDRRTIVEIKKQPVIVRTGKFAKRNWVSAVIAVLLTAILSFIFVLDFDDNPYSFTTDTNKIYIKNKSGKILWTKSRRTSKHLIDEPNYLKGIVKILDIDMDDKNEVLFAWYTHATELEDEFSPLICFSSSGEIIWKYSFKDEVSSIREKLLPVYMIFMIDTLTFDGTKSLFAFAGNSPSFSSAIFRLELKSGKRLPGTVWCSGHIVNGIIKDINGDSKNDFLCVGVDNGYEDAVLFGIEIDTLTLVRPTTYEYLIKKYPFGDFITYLRFPNTDYDDYMKYRMPAIYESSFHDDISQKFYEFSTFDILNIQGSCLWYQVDYNLKDVKIVIDNRFRIMRDTLVAHDNISLPYTDTPEYVEILKSKILYYKEGKWVQRAELE